MTRDRSATGQGQKPKNQSDSFGAVVMQSDSPKANRNAPPAKGEHSHDDETLSVKCTLNFDKPCLFCKNDHTVEQCEKLRGKPHEERINFLKSKGLCFRCL